MPRSAFRVGLGGIPVLLITLLSAPVLAGGGPPIVQAEVFDFDANGRSDILVDTNGAPIRVVQLDGASNIGNTFPAISAGAIVFIAVM